MMESPIKMMSQGLSLNALTLFTQSSRCCTPVALPGAALLTKYLLPSGMEVDGTELEDIVSAIPEPQEKLNRSRLVRVGSVGSVGRYRMGSG